MASRPFTARPGPRPGRAVHPWAWWIWAIGVAVATSVTTNPLFLVLLGAAVLFVVVQRRSDAAWARSLPTYLTLAATVIVIRMFFQVIFGASIGSHVLLTLPRVPLPSWAAGIRIGGPVTAEALLFTLYDSLRLGLMLLCVGAANTLANPRRALKNVPAALYELSVAVTIALTLAPQLIESTQRIRRARRLRGGASTGWRALRAVVIPVLQDAVDRSLSLAAGMEVRGFGRTRRDAPHRTVATTALLVGSAGATLGVFLLLGVGHSPAAPTAVLIVSLILIVIGTRLSGARLAVTRYRPDPWQAPEWIVVVAGVGAAIIGLLLGTTAPTLIATTQLEWPSLDPLMILAAACTAAPGILTPSPDRNPRS